MEEGKVVQKVEILSCVSGKTGNPYKQIAITFNNGYVYKNFLSDEQFFILKGILTESK